MISYTNARIIARILFYARGKHIVSNSTCAEVSSAEVEKRQWHTWSKYHGCQVVYAERVNSLAFVCESRL